MASSSSSVPGGNGDPDRSSSEIAGEATPLLGTIDDTKSASTSAADTEEGESRPILARPNDKPLPRVQIFCLCYARLIEPVAFFSIFPYINRMVQENGNLDEADVGFYGGLIESLFSLTQMLVMLFWGRAADRWGRKPVLVSSLVGVAASTSLFGLARALWQMILLRCLAGVFAGTVVTIRTMVAEHSTPATQARAFSWFAFAGNVGIFLGPLIGGALADPATQYPTLFGDVRFFKEFPYALSSMVVGCIGLTAVVTSTLFIEETLYKVRSRGNTNTNPALSTGNDEEASVPSRSPPSALDLLKAPGVGIVLFNYGHAMLLGFAYTAVVPVFLFTTPALGGFGFTPLQISLFMGLTGLAQATWLLLLFPPLQHRYGTNGVLRACGFAWPVFLGVMPFLNLMLYQGTHTAETAFWVLAPVLLVIGSGVSMSFTAVQLALNDVSPSPETLGTLNALALAVASGLRSFSPALFTSLFAIGVGSQILWGYLVWAVMAVLAIGFTFSTRYLPKASENDGGVRAELAQEEDEHENNN
ncbi:hypothetical protein AAE478_005112 [Parahypoxylon ruwenzoriense]